MPHFENRRGKDVDQKKRNTQDDAVPHHRAKWQSKESTTLFLQPVRTIKFIPLDVLVLPLPLQALERTRG